MNKTLFAVAMTVASAGALRGQTVGSLPDRSPYFDLNDGQRFGLVAGWLSTGSDAVGVNIKSAPIFGLRYDLAIGGPVYLTASVFGGSTSRTILDYTRSRATRDVGNEASTIISPNVSVAMALTGKRTWHRLQPLVNIGAGVITAAGDRTDVSGYSFGTNFDFSYGLGLRYSTGGNSEFRLDLNQYWWELHYPNLYRSTQGDPIAIKPAGALNSYTANTAFTLTWTIHHLRLPFP